LCENYFVKNLDKKSTGIGKKVVELLLAPATSLIVSKNLNVIASSCSPSTFAASDNF